MAEAKEEREAVKIASDFVKRSKTLLNFLLYRILSLPGENHFKENICFTVFHYLIGGFLLWH